MEADVTWVIAPSRGIAPQIAQRAAATQGAVTALAGSYAGRGQSQMQAGAPWNDQSGYARSALYGRAEGTTVVLGTANDEYGQYLEGGTSRMAPRPIIGPTAAELAPAYFRDAGTVVMAIWAGRGAY